MSVSYISQIDQLVKINIDAENGYREAMSLTNDLDLREVFYQFALDRQQKASSLKNQLRLLGENPSTSGSVKASLHRAWMSFTAEVWTDSDVVILQECVRGEKKALQIYTEVLQAEPLPASLRTLVIKHQNDIEVALGQINEWLRLCEDKVQSSEKAMVE